MLGKCQRIIKNKAGWTGYGYVTHPRYGTVPDMLDWVRTMVCCRNQAVEGPRAEGKPRLLLSLRGFGEAVSVLAQDWLAGQGQLGDAMEQSPQGRSICSLSAWTSIQGEQDQPPAAGTVTGSI